jgi:hypothetical protein
MTADAMMLNLIEGFRNGDTDENKTKTGDSGRAREGTVTRG